MCPASSTCSPPCSSMNSQGSHYCTCFLHVKAQNLQVTAPVTEAGSTTAGLCVQLCQPGLPFSAPHSSCDGGTLQETYQKVPSTPHSAGFSAQTERYTTKSISSATHFGGQEVWPKSAGAQGTLKGRSQALQASQGLRGEDPSAGASRRRLGNPSPCGEHGVKEGQYKYQPFLIKQGFATR